MKHQSGEPAPYRGIYMSDCRCRAEATVLKGKPFPTCPKCRQAVVWFFNRSVWSERPPPTMPKPEPPGTM